MKQAEGGVPRTGPIMVACQWKRSSPVGPAEHDDGGSRPRSMSSCMRARCEYDGQLYSAFSRREQEN